MPSQRSVLLTPTDMSATSTRRSPTTALEDTEFDGRDKNKSNLDMKTAYHSVKRAAAVAGCTWTRNHRRPASRLVGAGAETAKSARDGSVTSTKSSPGASNRAARAQPAMNCRGGADDHELGAGLSAYYRRRSDRHHDHLFRLNSGGHRLLP